jgi:hypothetical protein
MTATYSLHQCNCIFYHTTTLPTSTMWNSPTKVLFNGAAIGCLLSVCNALPQATTTTGPTHSPSVPAIPWSTKVDAFRAYILQQQDRNATKGFGNGPTIQESFADGDCLQVRFYNWDCFYDIPYKMKGVVKALDDSGLRDHGPITEPYRFYTYNYYSDPGNGWNFYNEARLAFGACGNRGPQSSCGVGWCVDKDGNSAGYSPGFVVPPGQSPYVDPNNRDNICPWLKENGTATA